MPDTYPLDRDTQLRRTAYLVLPESYDELSTDPRLSDPKVQDLPAPLLDPAVSRDASSVPDLNPFIRRELSHMRGVYMSRLGIVLYAACIVLYGARLMIGNLPPVPDWLPWTAGALSALAAVSLLALQTRSQRTWVYVGFCLIGAGLITLLQYYFGTYSTFSDFYLLTVLVPVLFFSFRWALTTVIIVSAMSVIPYLWGPDTAAAALLSHLLVSVPVYVILALSINVVMAGMRDQWIQSTKERRLGRDFAVIQQLTTYISSTHDMEAICRAVVDQLHSSFGYRFVSIYLTEGDKLKLMAQHGYDERLADLPLRGGVMARTVSSAEPILITSAGEITDFIYAMPDIRCEATAPILKRLAGGDDMEVPRVLGCINLEDTAEGALGEADLNLIVTVAGALSVALENARLLLQSQERGNRLELVNHVAQAIAAKTDLNGVLRAARSSLQGLTLVDRMTLSLLSADKSLVELVALDGLTSANLREVGSLTPLEDFQPAAVLQGECLVISEVQADSPYLFERKLYEAGLRSYVGIPLISRDEVLGIFALSSFEPWAYTEKTLPLLVSISPHLTTAVQNAILYRDIKQRAETDELTKLLNLPTFYSRLNELLVSYRTEGKPLTVVMLDLDLFKSYNDSFGHVAGDSVLRQVAALIRQFLRPEDIAARYGGDEFSIILPGLSAEDALETVGALCERIGRTPFQPENDPQTKDGVVRTRGMAMLSASAGLASFPVDSTDSEHLVHLADTALYEAKRRGRNRACAYNAFGPGRTRAADTAAASRRRRLQGLPDADAESDATEARESRASLNDYLQAVYALVTAIELRDGYTHGHSERVAFYAVRLGEVYGMEGNDLSALRIAGLLHDIGKIALPYDVIHKPGKLSPEEWELVKQHPLHGEGILRPLRNFAAVWPIVSAHHENYDGSGYPRSLAKEEIPLGGRILRIADSYEVMTVAGRAYQKRAKTAIEAVAELRRCAGTMFDPELVEVFIEQVIGDPRSSVFYNPQTKPLSSEKLNASLLTQSSPFERTEILVEDLTD